MNWIGLILVFNVGYFVSQTFRDIKTKDIRVISISAFACAINIAGWILVISN
jgi:uncharacterized protein with PQ loop repeat